MTLLQSRLVAILRKRVNIRGMVGLVSYAELADALASGATVEEVRAALVDLREDGFFPGKPELSERDFLREASGVAARESGTVVG